MEILLALLCLLVVPVLGCFFCVGLALLFDGSSSANGDDEHEVSSCSSDSHDCYGDSYD